MIFTSESLEVSSGVNMNNVVKNIQDTASIMNDNSICLRKLISQYKKNNTLAMIKKGTNKPKMEKNEKFLGDS